MDDMDLTIPPRREHASSGADDVTMPGKRDRKPDGRFDIGDLIMRRYKVLAELGQGGMGVVYKCFDETAGIEVALKALPPELSHNTLEMEDIKDNFQLVHNLHHPNIASSNNLEKDNSNGNYYLIMECCEGEDLRRWLRRKRKEGELTLDDILPIVKQVADALDYAHKMKIIHRDIKPGNIMIDQFGKIKVLDFGLAAQIHTSMTRVSMAYYGTSGTGPYMAPEQWEGRLQDAKADQYALAVMTYEMLSGHPPFESTDAAVLREAVLKSTVPPLANVPKSAEAAILRAMSKTPAERFENCSDFAAALGGKKVKAANIQNNVDLNKIGKLGIVSLIIVICCTIGYFAGRRADSGTSEFDGTVNLPDGIKLEMVKVEPGTFTMSKRDGENFSWEVEHQKTLTKTFYIGKYEVTNEQWCAVMGVSQAPSLKNKGARYPVEYISWHEAMSFCEKMNQYAPSGWKFTLPTETQWEFAARGGNKSCGYKYSGSNDIGDVCWYDSNSGSTTYEVGKKSPNELGLYDMSGNVWEWCLDNWNGKSNNTSAEFSRSYSDNDGSHRVNRGGSWCGNASYCRSADRRSSGPGFRYNNLGFRLALVPIE